MQNVGTSRDSALLPLQCRASFIKTNSYCVLENLYTQRNSDSACDCENSFTICTDIGNILSKSSNRPLRFYQFSSKS